MIIMADERFQNPKNKSEISHWLRDRIQISSGFADLETKMREFQNRIKLMNLMPANLITMPQIKEDLYLTDHKSVAPPITLAP
jgi:hypothetical protein